MYNNGGVGFSRGGFSAEVNHLWNEAETNNPNVIKVSMDQGKIVKVPKDGPEKTIWTYALRGCYCCVVYVEHSNGTRSAILTHYPPTKISQNSAELQKLIEQNFETKETTTKQTVLVMAPGEWIQDPTTKKFGMIVDQQKVDQLVHAVQDKFEFSVDVRVKAYSVKRRANQKDQGVLSVHIPPFGKGKANYKTWFDCETLGE